MNDAPRQGDSTGYGLPGPYANKTVAEIVHDYVVIRGDLVDQYARDQFVRLIEERLALAWDEGAQKRAQYDPACSVRDLNPYRGPSDDLCIECGQEIPTTPTCGAMAHTLSTRVTAPADSPTNQGGR